MTASEIRSEGPVKHVKTRLFSVVALAMTACAVGFVGDSVYRIATDSFVAPIVLTPDSDLVIQSKLALGQLLAERLKLQTRRDQNDTTIAASDEAIGELRALRRESEKALDWSKAMAGKQVRTGSLDLRALDRQRAMTNDLITRQRERLDSMKKDVDAGLVAKAEYEREVQSLSQLELGLLDRERARFASELQTAQATLAQTALRGAPGDMATPEMVMHRDQIVRIGCDILKLEAEKRAAIAERGHLDEELEKLDTLVAQLKGRPVFRATEAETNVAFIPYTQIDGAVRGAPVLDCVWGVVACKKVGKLAELLPGEVVVPDPWGTPTRGQYAILDLSDPHAAQSRLLRLRPSGAVPTRAPVQEPRPHTLAER